MTMGLENGDYRPDGQGAFCTVSEKEEVLQRILFQLTARRGAFCFLPQLGSRLYRLPMEKPSQRPALAKLYVEEALAMESEVEVSQVLWKETSGELRVDLLWREETLSLSLRSERTEN